MEGYEELYDKIQEFTNEMNNFFGMAKFNGVEMDDYTKELVEKMENISRELSETSHELEEHLAWDNTEINENRKMNKKQRIRINESQLKQIVKKSVKRMLKEWDDDEEDGYFDAEDAIECACNDFGEGICVISGKLGLWDGVHEIQPVECNTIREAIYKCLGRDCEILSYDDVYYDEQEDAVIVNAHHHDGTNKFKISRL